MADDPEMEHRLEAMFASLAPDPVFRERLWRQLRTRRPWWRGLFAGPTAVTRLAPVLAVVLIVAGGLGYLVANRPAGGGSASSAAAPAFRSSPAGFGRLPRPGLAAADGQAHGAGVALAPSQRMLPAYRFTGSLPILPSIAMVYRYEEPDATRRATLSADLAAASGLSVTVAASRPGAGTPPLFTADGTIPVPAAGSAQVDAAEAILRQLHLMPAYPTRRVVSGDTLALVREFPVAGQPVPLVDGQGNPLGVQIGLSQVHRPIIGPVDLPLASAGYPLRAGVELAGSLPSPSGDPARGALLDRAELVYVAVSTGAAQGYLEPAIRLSGPGGTVLVPAVALDHLMP